MGSIGLAGIAVNTSGESFSDNENRGEIHSSVHHSSKRTPTIPAIKRAPSKAAVLGYGVHRPSRYRFNAISKRCGSVSFGSFMMKAPSHTVGTRDCCLLVSRDTHRN